MNNQPNVYVFCRKHYHVCTDSPIAGKQASWASFTCWHVAHQFAVWMDTEIDIARLSYRIETATCQAEDYEDMSLIERRSRHECAVSNPRLSIYDMAYQEARHGTE